ncbi:hypothetical protein [Rhizobium ruizarguesonis]|uniref:hypothetical protein n=1 Tax=Rhizobium ruizarguesonis TaxID=2081791 RepID=UPI00102F941C|nr:hypothetical protein [Rhizobium ruizarguesonis]TBE09286.1 hypothetical protein ELH12_26180 [Rhizobium ruizarguesonis]TBE80443.1 hypothetical protein ELH01_25980 [Rhizobium ruizarguesonis]TBE90098.1 hypothetical protein ELG99_26165 [Rhizobium ruizarguesonis]
MPNAIANLPEEVLVLTALADRIGHWPLPSNIPASESQKFRRAFDSVDLALRKTIQYLRLRAEGRGPIVEEEYKLSDLWSKACADTAPVDQQLSDLCFFKGLGWSDPKKWEDADARQLDISISNMERNLIYLSRRLGRAINEKKTPNWFHIAGFLFAFLTFVSLLYLMIGPSLDPNRGRIFDAWLAFCLAASFAFIGGTANATGHLPIPLLRDKPMQFSVGGGIAVFVITLLVLNVFS